MWRNLTLASVGVFFCLPFTPIGLWPVLPFVAWGGCEIPSMLERARFAKQVRRELEEMTNAGTR